MSSCGVSDTERHPSMPFIILYHATHCTAVPCLNYKEIVVLIIIIIIIFVSNNNSKN